MSYAKCNWKLYLLYRVSVQFGCIDTACAKLCKLGVADCLNFKCEFGYFQFTDTKNNNAKLCLPWYNYDITILVHISLSPTNWVSIAKIVIRTPTRGNPAEPAPITIKSKVAIQPTEHISSSKCPIRSCIMWPQPPPKYLNMPTEILTSPWRPINARAVKNFAMTPTTPLVILWTRITSIKDSSAIPPTTLMGRCAPPALRVATRAQRRLIVRCARRATRTTNIIHTASNVLRGASLAMPGRPSPIASSAPLKP